MCSFFLQLLIFIWHTYGMSIMFVVRVMSLASGYEPCLQICKLAYSEWVSKPGNRGGGGGRKGIRHKNTFGCMVRLILALVCVAAAGLLVVIEWEA